MALSILYVGGTGQISLPCVKLSVAAGHKVTVFNRGVRDETLPRKVKQITGDMRDPDAYSKLLGKKKWDVVAQFMVFTPEQLQLDLDTFSGNVGQYVFISSASVYEKPPHHYVITEKTPAINPYWPYSQAKIACENLLKGEKKLAWTIVRPSHTVRSGLPTMMNEGDMIARRMLAGKPVIVAGDGATPWTLTRSEDFAVPFVGLLGNRKALGEIFHITGDKGFTWDAIYRGIAKGLGVEAKIVHVPTDTLCRYKPDWDGPLLGDKTWAALFDNKKVKRVAGKFSCAEDLDVILEQPLAYLKQRLAGKPDEAHPLDELYDRICAEQSALGS
jgi:nucleoside-diphosphate-sugar epimerase